MEYIALAIPYSVVHCVPLDLMMMMMMMMCNDLMCTYKLTRSQLSTAHNARVKTDKVTDFTGKFTCYRVRISCLVQQRSAARCRGGIVNL